MTMNLQILTVITTPDLINSVTAFAALITAIIALITINEIRKQREHSYHPDINIANFEFYVYRFDKEDTEEGEEEQTYLYYSKISLNEEDKKIGYNELTIDINNIGFGVAKEVSWDWYFDFDKAKEAIEFKEEGFIFQINDGDLHVVIPSLKVDWYYSIGEENSGDYFNFILPYSIENRKNSIGIPSYFTDLYWIYKSKDIVIKSSTNKIEYPPLKLSISYTNIHGKKTNKIFLVFLSYHFIANPMIENSELGNFEFKIIEFHA
jgi:hypothetical protein